MEGPKQVVLRSFRRFLASLGLILASIALIILILSYFFAGEIYDYKDTVDSAHLPQVDAIVCLAGGRGRIAAAGDLWYRYWEMAHQPQSAIKTAPVLYISGMGPQANWNILTKQLKNRVVQAIRPEDVVIERESSNTDENARWLAHYANRRRWQSILLLTSSYHMRRSHFIFEHVFKTMSLPLKIELYSVYQEPFGSEEWRSGSTGSRVTMMEYIKWIYYRALYGFANTIP